MNFINKNIKWISLGGHVLSFISLFLPFATVSANALGIDINQSISYIEGDGIIVLFALVVGAILLFLKNNKFSLIPLGIGLAITIYSSINVGNGVGDISSLYGDMIKVSFGAGFYLLYLGLIVAVGSLIYGNFIMKKVANNQPVNNVQPMQQNNYNQPMNNTNAQVMPEQNMSNTCSKCGATQNPGAKFCEYCGNQLN